MNSGGKSSKAYAKKSPTLYVGEYLQIAFSSLIQTVLSVLELHQISCQKSDRSRTVTAGWEFCLSDIDKKSPYPEEFPCSFEVIIAQADIKYKYKFEKPGAFRHRSEQ